MSLLSLSPLLALGQPLQPGQPAPPVWTNLVPVLLLVGVFYFALIRPQQKKAKEHALLLKTVRRGDEVLTSGGIVGEVVTVKDKTIVLRSADAKFEVTKTAVTEITRRTGESNQS
jgi:preprotein translocase subunit YajC